MDGLFGWGGDRLRVFMFVAMFVLFFMQAKFAL
jgi:hypothetical protein